MSQGKLTFNPETRQMERGSGTVTKGLGGWNFLTGGELGGARTGDLTKPYANSVWVQSAIAHCFNPIKTVPLNLAIDDEPLKTDDLLHFLDRPMASQGGRMKMGSLIEASIVWKKLCGEFFWILDDSWLDPRIQLSNKSPILIVRPDEMTGICDRDSGDLMGWNYRPHNGKGRGEELLADQVIHKKRFNPDDPIRGLGQWESAATAAETDHSAGTFAKALMDSNGDRGPTIFGDGSISDEQYEQITRALREKQDRNRRGEFRPLFLVGNDLKIQEPAMQAIDANYVAQRMGDRHEIFVAFGVPPSFADVTASYSIGSASDKLVNIENNAEPESTDISDAIEEVLNGSGSRRPVKELQGKLVVAAFDWDEHPTKQQVRAERMEAATKAVDRGMPWRDASDYFNLRLPEFAGDDIGRVPANLVELGRNPQPGREKILKSLPAGHGQKSPDPLAFVQKAFEDRDQTHRAKALDDHSAARLALWKKLHAARKPWEKRFKSRFTRLTYEARKRTLAKIELAGNGGFLETTEKALVTKAESVDLIFDLPDWLEEFLAGMYDVHRSTMVSARKEVWIEELFHDDDPAEMPDAAVLQALRKREDKLVNTAEGIHEAIQAALETGLDEGDTMDELAARVKGAFNGIDDERALRIAVTETTAAYETARQATFEEAGIEFKEWLTSGDDRVRLDHFHVDGNIVPVEGTFAVGGSQLLHPGDPDGPPDQVINCRCLTIASIGPATEPKP